jgi:hypothetical protein
MQEESSFSCSKKIAQLHAKILKNFVLGKWGSEKKENLFHIETRNFLELFRDS